MKFYDDYKIQSGWIHDYYCDIDGAELIFDIKNSCFSNVLYATLI